MFSFGWFFVAQRILLSDIVHILHCFALKYVCLLLFFTFNIDHTKTVPIRQFIQKQTPRGEGWIFEEVWGLFNEISTKS